MYVHQIHVRMVGPVWMEIVPIVVYVFLSRRMDKIAKTVSFNVKIRTIAA